MQRLCLGKSKSWHAERRDLPSGSTLLLRAQSVIWRTKSKKKSPSGILITLSPILMNRLNPSCDFIFSLPAIVLTRSPPLVDDLTMNA